MAEDRVSCSGLWKAADSIETFKHLNSSLQEEPRRGCKWTRHYLYSALEPKLRLASMWLVMLWLVIISQRQQVLLPVLKFLIYWVCFPPHRKWRLLWLYQHHAGSQSRFVRCPTYWLSSSNSWTCPTSRAHEPLLNTFVPHLHCCLFRAFDHDLPNGGRLLSTCH